MDVIFSLKNICFHIINLSLRDFLEKIVYLCVVPLDLPKLQIVEYAISIFQYSKISNEDVYLALLFLVFSCKVYLGPLDVMKDVITM